MRAEIKIGLGLFAASTLIGHFFTIEFITGALFVLALFFMVIGMISEKNYQIFRNRQKQKMKLLKRVVGMS